MILVDSSVWVDFFNQAKTPQSLQLQLWLERGDVSLGTADLVVFEVLRGFRRDKACQGAQSLLAELPVVDIGGLDNALHAATLYRRLRAQGRTVRSPIDVLLASYCMTHGHTLLHRDADFESLKTLGGLETWPN
ncbi:PilT protein domain-containing protein [Hydrogenophaga taeniospiralis CCUG 15921]|uniref:Ribonuclease VapC n=1 Tax=Hydrogenophaga taeniospiralis CCUG 15921 TaxID=1281780 RepID=A0A9X4SEW8_9BURK|nr:PIN domain-containing protein [Hydrogenophaga taeniospiralis]MDG5975481.1 PilT protein domain-containing protein [Hydrogenophaga taeniospiralis CCUG 15921]